MAYVAMTTISGFDTLEAAPRGDDSFASYRDVFRPWFDKHHHIAVLSGHWSTAACLRYMARRGLVVGDIEHKTSDSNGKGYGSFDARWTVTDGVATKVEVTREMDEAFAEQDSRDVWDAEH